MPASAVAPITIAAHLVQSSCLTAVTNAAVFCAKTLPTPATSTQGEFCSRFAIKRNYKKPHIFFRLVFDDNRNLMGMCVFDDLGQRLYHEGDDSFTRSCHSYSPCSSSNSCCGEDTLSNSCHSYSDMTYSFDRAFSLTDSMFNGPNESVIYEDSDVSYFYEEWEEKAYDYFEDFVDWLACLDMNA